MKQLPLFTDATPTTLHVTSPSALARTTDPATSVEAAAKVNVPGSWRTVAKALDQLGQASSYEIEVFAKHTTLAISASRIRGSLSQKEMLGRGFVEIASIESASEFGNDAQVYRLTALGQAMLLD